MRGGRKQSPPWPSRSCWSLLPPPQPLLPPAWRRCCRRRLPPSPVACALLPSLLQPLLLLPPPPLQPLLLLLLPSCLGAAQRRGMPDCGGGVEVEVCACVCEGGKSEGGKE